MTINSDNEWIDASIRLPEEYKECLIVREVPGWGLNDYYNVVDTGHFCLSQGWRNNNSIPFNVNENKKHDQGVLYWMYLDFLPSYK